MKPLVAPFAGVSLSDFDAWKEKQQTGATDQIVDPASVAQDGMRFYDQWSEELSAGNIDADPEQLLSLVQDAVKPQAEAGKARDWRGLSLPYVVQNPRFQELEPDQQNQILDDLWENGIRPAFNPDTTPEELNAERWNFVYQSHKLTLQAKKNASGQAEADITDELASNPLTSDVLGRLQKPDIVEKLGFLDALKETGDDPMRVVPFLGSANDIATVVELGFAARRMLNDEESEDDLLLLKEFNDKQTADRSIGYVVGDILTRMPAYMGELGLTWGGYTAGKIATEKAAIAALKKVIGGAADNILKRKLAQLAIKSMGVAGGSARQAFFGKSGIGSSVLRLPEDVIERMNPEVKITSDELGVINDIDVIKGEDFWTAFRKAVPNQFVEVASEHTGGLLNAAATPVKNFMLKAAVFRAFKKANPTVKGQAFRDFIERVGWDGVASEWTEERIGEAGRFVLGVDDFEYQLPTVDQMLAELIAFSAPGAGAYALDRGLNPSDPSKPPERNPEAESTFNAVNELAKQRGGPLMAGDALEQMTRDANKSAGRSDIPKLFADAGLTDNKARLSFIEETTGLQLDNVADIYDADPETQDKVRARLEGMKPAEDAGKGATASKEKGATDKKAPEPKTATARSQNYIKGLIHQQFNIDPKDDERHAKRRQVLQGLIGTGKDVEALTKEEANKVITSLQEMQKKSKAEAKKNPKPKVVAPVVSETPPTPETVPVEDLPPVSEVASDDRILDRITKEANPLPNPKQRESRALDIYAEETGMPRDQVTVKDLTNLKATPLAPRSLTPEDQVELAAEADATPKVAEPPAPVEGVPPSSEFFGSTNTVFTKDAADKARELIRAKLKGGQVNVSIVGLDPEIVQAGIQLAGYYIEGGLRKFSAYSAQMVADFGEEVRPYLRSWYEAVRWNPGFDNAGMSTSDEIDKEVLNESGNRRTDNRPDGQSELGDSGRGIGGADNAQRDLRDNPDEPAVGRGSGSDVRDGSSEGLAEDELRGEGAVGAGVRGSDASGDGRTEDAGSDNIADTVDDLIDATEASQPPEPIKADRSDKDEGKGASEIGTEFGHVRRGGPAVSNLINYRITDEDNLGDGGKKTKYRNNVNAIKLLKIIEEQERKATPEEQSILVKYVGWGGIAEAFGNRWSHPDWLKEQEEIKTLLTSEERDLAARSTQYAHYTSPEIIRAMWEGFERIGYNLTGRVAEPGMGIGHFFGLMPDRYMAKAKLFGVEMDSISARIARQLYQGANVIDQPYQDVDIPDNFFDLFISNVPFSGNTVIDRKLPQISGRLQLHDYYFYKSLLKTRPGGLVMFITSTGTMDKKTNFARTKIAELGNLLTAIRLPSDSFEKNAGTSVTTDILVFQRRPEGEPYSGEEFIESSNIDLLKGFDEPDWHINNYWQTHQDHLFGEIVADKLFAGRSRPGLKSTGLPIAESITEAIRLSQVRIDWSKEGWVPLDSSKRLKKSWGSLLIGSDGSIVQLMEDVDGKREIPFRRNDKDLTEKETARIAAWIKVRDAGHALIKLQMDANAKEKDVAKARSDLNKAYDAAFKKFKGFHSNYNKMFFRTDPDIAFLLSLEQYNPDAGETSKEAIFSKRTQFPIKEVTSANSAVDALTASLVNRGRVDLPYMASLYAGHTEEQIAEELGDRVYDNPEGSIETVETYLTGNVRQKLRAAKAAVDHDKKYQRNIAPLEAVIPEDIPPHEIDVRLGATWIDPGTYTEFIRYLGITQYGHPVEVNFHAETSVSSAVWEVDAKPQVSREWGTDDVHALKLIELAMNHKMPTVTRKVGDATIHLPEETALAQDSQRKIKEEFKRWLWLDQGRTDKYFTRYNDLFNAVVIPKYDGSHLQFPGLAEGINLRPHQKNVVWRIITSGNTLMAHTVGAGKTFAAVATAMESKRMGLARKTVITVPKPVVDQFARDVLKLYPSAKALLTTGDDFTPLNRQVTINRIMTGDWDVVVIPHTSFEKIPVSPARVERFIRDQLSDIDSRLDSKVEQDPSGRDRTTGKGKKDRTVKQLEKLKEKLEAKLKDLTNTDRKDPGPFFEDLGIEMLFVDEAHKYKNLFFHTHIDAPGVGAGSDTDRSIDMWMKSKYLNEVTRGRGVAFMTGTPITNSISEMFTMQRYLQPGVLEDNGIASFDSWAMNFGEVQSQVETTPTGTGFRVHQRFTKFTNVPELMQMYLSMTDVILPRDLKDIKIPKMRGGKPEVSDNDGHPRLKAYLRDLDRRMELIKSKRPEVLYVKDDGTEALDNPLVVTGDGKKAALDFRLIDPSAPDFPGSKVNACVQNVYDIWKETESDKSVQVIWSDMGVPSDKFNIKHFNLYEDIRGKLVGKGVPKAEVAFIHEWNTDDQKDELYRKLRLGTIRVIIASTGKMGVGANLQDKLIAAHHLDVPWTPADIEQRDGRIVRQGNTNDEVRVIRYVTKRSFDSYMWQTIETKARFIFQILSGGSASTREIEEIGQSVLSAAEVKAISTDNPGILKYVQLEADVRRMRALVKGEQSANWRVRGLVNHLPGRIAEDEAKLAGLEKEQSRIDTERAGNKTHGLSIGYKRFTDPKEERKALEELLKPLSDVIKAKALLSQSDLRGLFAATDTMNAAVKDLNLKGLSIYDRPIEVTFGSFGTNASLILRSGNFTSTSFGESADGNATRILTLFDHLKSKIESLTSDIARSKAELADAEKTVNLKSDNAEKLSGMESDLKLLEGELKESATTKVDEVDDEAEARQYESDQRTIASMGSGSNLGQLSQPGMMGALYRTAVADIQNGATKFGEWAADMLTRFGQAVKPYLRKAWTQAKQYLQGQFAERDKDIEYMNAGIPLNEVVSSAKSIERSVHQWFVNKDGSKKTYTAMFQFMLGRPLRTLELYLSGRRLVKVLREAGIELGMLASQAISRMEDATDRLSSVEMQWLKSYFAKWYEQGADEKSPFLRPLGGLTPALKNWTENYRFMKGFIDENDDVQGLFAKAAVNAGMTVKRREPIRLRMGRLQSQLMQLKERQKAGEKGLRNKIGRIEDEIAEWKIKLAGGERFTGGFVIDPFRDHIMPFHFTHFLADEARNAIVDLKGEEYDAIRAYTDAHGINFRELMGLADPTQVRQDRQFGPLEQMRIADLPWSVIIKSGPEWEAVAEAFTRKGGDPAEVWIPEDLPLSLRGAARTLRVLESDPITEVEHYAFGAARRIAILNAVRASDPQYYKGKEWDDQELMIHDFADRMIQGLVAEGGGDHANTASGVWQAFMGLDAPKRRQRMGRIIEDGYRNLLDIISAIQLSGGAITNLLGGWYPVIAKAGVGSTARALKTVLYSSHLGDKEAEAILEATREMGAWSRNSLGQLAEVTAMRGKVRKFTNASLRAVGFEAINRTINKTASVAAIYNLDQRLARIRAGHSRSGFYRAQMMRAYAWTGADIERIVNGKPNLKDYATVTRRMVAETNVSGLDAMDAPLWTHTELGKRLGAFTSWYRQMGYVMMDAVWEAKQGEPGKLVAMLIGGVISTALVDAVRDFLKDQNDEWWWNLTFALLGGLNLGFLAIMAESALWAVRKQGGILTNFIQDNLIFPQAAWLAKFGDQFIKLFKYDDYKAFHDWVKSFPAGSIVETNLYRLFHAEWDTGLNEPRGRGSRAVQGGYNFKPIVNYPVAADR